MCVYREVLSVCETLGVQVGQNIHKVVRRYGKTAETGRYMGVCGPCHVMVDRDGSVRGGWSQTTKCLGLDHGRSCQIMGSVLIAVA